MRTLSNGIFFVPNEGLLYAIEMGRNKEIPKR